MLPGLSHAHFWCVLNFIISNSVHNLLWTEFLCTVKEWRIPNLVLEIYCECATFEVSNFFAIMCRGTFIHTKCLRFCEILWVALYV